MNNKLIKLKEFMSRSGYSEKEIQRKVSDTFDLSLHIAIFAHFGQKLDNEECYMEHPISMFIKYHKLISYDPDTFTEKQKEYIDVIGIPFKGVSELCALHDVITNTDFTMNDIEEIFIEFGHKSHFDNFIKSPLEILSSSKIDNDEYIELCMTNKTAAFVKMMDLQEKVSFMTFGEFKEPELEFSHRYLDYAFKINMKFKFVERLHQFNIVKN